MKLPLRLVSIIFLYTPFTAFSQKDTLINKLDSLSKKTDSVGGQFNNVNSEAYNSKTKLTGNTYFILLGNDLKQAFTKPFHMKQRDWWRFGKFAVLTGALMFADEPVQKYVTKTTDNHSALKNFGNNISTFGGLGEVAVLTGFGAYGYVFKKEKMVTTTLLATQAYLTASAVESVTKFVTGRTRPSFYDSGVEPEPRFLGPVSKSKNASGKKLFSSFPSGHTTVVFAAATVFAKEYYNKPLIPIFSYAVATLVGVSRIIANAHWTTDVLAGAALGYLNGRLVVNNYHRYAKIRAPKQDKNTFSFHLSYSHGLIMPGLIYKFR